MTAMLIVIVALAIAVVLALAALVIERRKSATQRQAATSALTTTQKSLDTQVQQTTRVQAALDQTKLELDEAANKIAQLDEDQKSNQSAILDLKAAADELSEIEQQSAERIAVLEIDIRRLKNGQSEIEPQLLWELELQRSERTWRHLVAVSPDHDPSPFPGAPDKLRLAVEVAAAGLKEEAGAFLSVDWQAAPVEDPARAHLILRLAQEMLAEAAREPIPARLTVEGTGAVTLTLAPSENEDIHLSLNLTAPDVSGQLIEIDSDQQARITVNYAKASSA